MAIWSIWAPVGIFTVNVFGDGIYHAVGQNLVTLLWVWTIVIVVIGILFAVVFRKPRCR